MTARAFSYDTLRELRAWARSRHIYGGKYGYPQQDPFHFNWALKEKHRGELGLANYAHVKTTYQLQGLIFRIIRLEHSVDSE